MSMSSFFVVSASPHSSSICRREILVDLVLKEALLSEYDAFDFVWNRFANTRGKADSNLELDRNQEHRIKLAKAFLNRLGVNFSPAFAQHYTRSLDVLTALAEEVDESLLCRARTSHHTDPDRTTSVKSLASFIKRMEWFIHDAERTCERKIKAINPLFDIEQKPLKAWVLRSLKTLESITELTAEQKRRR